MKKKLPSLILATLSIIVCNVADAVNGILPSTTTFYLEKNGQRMVVEITENNKDTGRTETVDCYLYGDRYIIDKLRESIPENSMKEVSKEEMRELVNQCSDFSFNKLGNEAFRIQKIPFSGFPDIFENFTIFPGTKWCGAGDIAENDDDLGRAVETDKCCRTHDKCNDSIAANETKHGLKNEDFYTKSNCACDDQFLSCLKNTSEVSSAIVGATYFDFLQTQCFKYDYPQVKCLDKCGIPFFNENCEEYELDYNGTKEYQYFEAKCYF